jgi:hypothetical protein
MPEGFGSSSPSPDRFFRRRSQGISPGHSSWTKLRTYGVERIFGGEGAPTHEEYADKLGDPRWHAFTDLVKRRRERCENCGSERHLQVHHLRYLPGLEPWEYPPGEVRLLCADCHARVHQIPQTQVRSSNTKKDLGSVPGVSAPSRIVPLDSAVLRDRLDQWVEVEGVLDELRQSPNQNLYLSLGGRYPKATLSVVIFPDYIPEFGGVPFQVGARIRISGRIKEYRGALQVIATSHRQITLITGSQS